MDHKEYYSFVNNLKNNGVNVHHIMFLDLYKNDRNQIENIIKSFPFEITDLTKSHPFFCKNLGKRNNHHYTFSYNYERIFPIIVKTLNIDFNKNEYNKIELKNKGVFIYEKKEKSVKFSFTDLNTKETIIDNHYNALRIIDKSVFDSPYHDVFRGAHRMCLIKNLALKNGKKLLLNCDSMMVPFVPLLSYYFEEILHLDNRTKKSFKKIIDEFHPSDYLCALITSNMLNEKYLLNLK